MTVVNFGCGAAPGRDCLNIDGSPTVLLARLPIPARLFGERARYVAAIRNYKVKFATARRLRFKNHSLDAFYTSHTLEHLPRGECEDLLCRLYNWLKPGGMLRVVLPDLKSLAASYASGDIDADTFVTHTHLADSRAQIISLGYSVHRWMYDRDSFIALLERLRYRNVHESSFGVSGLPQLAALDVEARREGSFYVEALK
jgi:trans-aconitate methyltransferase